MARTSKSTATTANTLSDNTTTPPDARQLAIFPPDKVIEAAKSRLRTAMVEQNDGQPVPEIVEKALERSIEWHEGQYRKSGEPYVVHPIEVAILLSRMSADTESIAAALLHDVVEDSGVPLSTISSEFSDRVGRLVDGVTKLGQIQWNGEGDADSRERAAQAENLRKMFLAMIDDIGVVLIKLADRLHNMRTLDYMPRDKQLRIALQTME